MTLRDLGRPVPRVIAATIEYRLAGRERCRRFSARRVDDAPLERALAAAGLRLAGSLDDARAWARAQPR